jgi:uncharacterized protein
VGDIRLFPLVILLSFGCELVDSSLGMGYGTTLTPVLLLLGFTPVEIVPAVLMSEFVTGVVAGFLHHEFGNVDFRPGSRDFKVMVVMTLLSVVGVVAAVSIAVSVPAIVIKIYVGVLVLLMGLVILYNRNRAFPFSWTRISILGLIAAFNKGISGGGYGPVVTGGQVLSGVDGPSAIGIVSLAEGFTSLVGAIAYLVSGSPFPWLLVPSLMLGSVVSTPLAAWAVSKLQPQRLTTAIGGATTILGTYTLYRVFF